MTNRLLNGDTDGTTSRADKCREKRLELIRTLESLYGELVKPGFDGTLVIEISAKDGRPGRVKGTLTRWGDA